jgi:hypothetical protein
VRESFLTAPEWAKRLRPVRKQLLDALAAEFSAGDSPEVQRTVAASILADYADDEPSLLARCLQQASPVQFRALFPAVKAQSERCIDLLQKVMADAPQRAEGDLRLRTRARANAATALLLLGHPEAVATCLGQDHEPPTTSAHRPFCWRWAPTPLPASFPPPSRLGWRPGWAKSSCRMTPARYTRQSSGYCGG